MSISETLGSVNPRIPFEHHSPIQLEWIKRQPLFKSRGYTLRQRFQPGWVPSWRRDPTVNVLDAEDRLSSMVSCDTRVKPRHDDLDLRPDARD